MTCYFLYARKSTDVEDKQVLSIEAQLAELRSLAKSEQLEIAGEFVEKRSAKQPGRPIFSAMIKLARKSRPPAGGLGLSPTLGSGGGTRTHNLLLNRESLYH